MPELATLYPDIDSMEQPILLSEYRNLVEKQRDLESRGEELSIDDLIRACAIMKALRRKAHGPPKVARQRKIAVSATVEDL